MCKPIMTSVSDSVSPRREVYRLFAASALLLVLGGLTNAGQAAERSAASNGAEPRAKLSTYVIEREIKDAGKLSPVELRDISRKSRDVLEKLGPNIRWVQSYVVDDKIYCVYQAPNKEIIRRHAEQGGFPANRISEVKNIISLKTAE